MLCRRACSAGTSSLIITIMAPGAAACEFLFPLPHSPPLLTSLPSESLRAGWFLARVVAALSHTADAA